MGPRTSATLATIPRQTVMPNKLCPRHALKATYKLEVQYLPLVLESGYPDVGILFLEVFEMSYSMGNFGI